MYQIQIQNHDGAWLNLGAPTVSYPDAARGAAAVVGGRVVCVDSITKE